MNGYNFDFNFIKSGAPVVTLSALGIAFNQPSRSLLGFPEAISIGFDKDKLAIGIRAVSKEDNEDSFEFEKKAKNGWVRLGCKEFSKYLSLW